MDTQNKGESARDWLSEISSEPIVFIIGPLGRRCYIHSAAVKGLSPVINTMLGAGMSESLTDIITWDDVSECVFIRFAAFVYTREYPAHPKELEIIKELKGYGAPYQCPALRMRAYDVEPKLQPLSLVLFRDIWDEWLDAKEKRPGGQGYQKGKAIKAFWDYHNLNDQNWGPRPWTGWQALPDDDRSDSPLDLHADLNVLADTYDIPSLGALATGKMVRSLSTMNFTRDLIPGLMKLFRGVYSRTRSGNSLRWAVAGYTVCMWDELRSSQDCQDLLIGEEDFRNDVESFMEVIEPMISDGDF